MTGRIGAKGQVVIPKGLRDQAQLLAASSVLDHPAAPSDARQFRVKGTPRLR
jgi:hypothetical protein